MTFSRSTTAALLVATALAAAACSDEADAASGTIEVTAVDFAFEGLPDRIERGSTLALTNRAATELHELVAIRLPDGEDRTADELVALPPDEMAGFFPDVTTVLIAPPGEAGMAVEGSAQLTEPGRYLVICAIPTGADPGEYLAAAAESEGGPPDVSGGPPHLVNGMYAEVEVVG